MAWSEFLNENGIGNKVIEKEILIPKYKFTNIKCPICNAELFKRIDTMFVIESIDSPPKHEYKCKRCGWCACV